VDHWIKEDKSNERHEIEVLKVGDTKPLWERDGAFLAATIAYFVAALLFVFLRTASGLGWFGLLADRIGNQATDIVANVLIQIFIFFLVPLIIFQIYARKQPLRKTLSDIGFRRPSRKVFGYSFLLGLLFYFFNIFVASISFLVLMVLGFRFPTAGGEVALVGTSGLLLGILMIGVLPGFCEEVSTRGILLRGFMSKLSVWRAILLSSLIFGFMHLNIMQAFFAAVLGAFIAIAILVTKNIWTGIIIHFMNNAMGVLLSYANANDWIIAQLYNQLFDLFLGPSGVIIYFVFVGVVYFSIMHILHMFARDTYKADEKQHFAMFLKNNPERVRAMINAGQTVSAEEMSRSVDAYVQGLGKMRAIRFYLEGQHKPQKLKPLEITLAFGLVFLTGAITIMTLVWGLL